MTICNLILTPIIAILHLFVQVLRTIVETVCHIVTTVIRTVKEVAQKICGYLPWPLSSLCKWGTKLIEVFETIVETICETILKTIVDLIEQIVEYVIFILHWVCWIIDWILFRWLALLFCRLGFKSRKCIPVCLTILADAREVQTITVDAAKAMVEKSNVLLQQCDITLVVESVKIVQKPDLIDNVPTGAGHLFSSAFRWFSSNVCYCCSGVTIYFVGSLDSKARGHAIPGTSYILVAVKDVVDDATIVHEIGHLCDLWSHDDEVGNVMSITTGTPPRTKIREHQCCMIGSSRFSRNCGHQLVVAESSGRKPPN